MSSNNWDVIVVGSGFGGVFAAAPLVAQGARVLMLERGEWVTRGSANWQPDGTLERTPYYSRDTPIEVIEGERSLVIGSTACVGGPSVFYGGVSLRLREADFDPNPEIVGASGARWPFGYAELEPFYERVEQQLEVAGEAGCDPTEPPRRGPYPAAAGPLGATSTMIASAGRALGLRPFALPLAIRYVGEGRSCQLCPTCDTFACAVSAKNDLATTLIPALMQQGLELRARTVATRLVLRGDRVTHVEALDRERGERVELRADHVILAAGALASPHLLLASGLAQRNPAAQAVGAYLTRHCNGVVVGVFPSWVPDRGKRFHKQVAFHDFYFGAAGGPAGPLGSIQQLQTPPIALVKANSPAWMRPFLGLALPHTTGLLVLASDQPRAENRVTLGSGPSDVFGLPQVRVHHHYTPRDEAGRAALMREGQRILRRAGARFFYRHHITTFSHAAGSVRFGDDASSAPLDRFCRFRGVSNLLVTDASFMPTCGGLNPSLTIAANALRVGEALAKGALPAMEGAA